MLLSFYKVSYSHPGLISHSFQVNKLDQLWDIWTTQYNSFYDKNISCLDIESIENNKHILQPLSKLIRTCPICNIYKLDGIHHCSTCRECIKSMDHHCPWIGNCVGKNNHKHFFLFLFYTSISGFIITLTSINQLSNQSLSVFNTISFLISTIVGGLFALTLGLFALSVFINTLSHTTIFEKKFGKHKPTYSAMSSIQDTLIDALILHYKPINSVSGIDIHPFYSFLSDHYSVEYQEELHNKTWSIYNIKHKLYSIIDFLLNQLKYLFGDDHISLYWLLPTNPRFNDECIEIILFKTLFG